MPAVPPYSSTTIARCARSRRISDSADSTLLLIGRSFTGRHTSPTSRRAGPGPVVQQVADVHEPDHVVVGLLVDRESGVPGAARRPRRLRTAASPRAGTPPRYAAPAPRGSGVCPRRRLRPRCAARPGRQRLMPGDQVAQLLVGHQPAGRLPDRRRAAARPGWCDFDSSQTNGLASTRDPVEDRGRDQRDSLGPLQRQPLGREFLKTRLKNEMASVTVISESTGRPQSRGMSLRERVTQAGRPASPRRTRRTAASRP